MLTNVEQNPDGSNFDEPKDHHLLEKVEFEFLIQSLIIDRVVWGN